MDLEDYTVKELKHIAKKNHICGYSNLRKKKLIALIKKVKKGGAGTSTSSDVRSPTSTSTKANTQGNSTITITGSSGNGPMNVYIGYIPPQQLKNLSATQIPILKGGRLTVYKA